MRTFLKLLILLVALPAMGQSTNRTPLNRSFLQSNLDANGQAITNAGTVRSTNFIDAATGLPIGGSSGITPAPGRNLEMVTVSSIATLSTITNPTFTTLFVTNPAASGSAAQISISGNTGQGGFQDLI